MENSGLILSTIFINSAIGIADKVFQIIYYAKRNFFPGTNLKKLDLSFIILPAAIHFFIYLMYVIFHHEPMLSPAIKIKNFIIYFFSSLFLFPIGIQKSLKNKFSDVANYSIPILRILNGIHVFFVSVPQILIVITNSLVLYERLRTIEIVCILLSSIFIIWSLIYYFICNAKEDDYEVIIYDFSKKI